MGLLQQLKHDVVTGWARLRQGTVQAANRAFEETELLKLSLEVRKLDRRIKDLYRDIGERTVELHERGARSDHILSDREIVRVVDQVMVLTAEREKLLADMRDVRSGS
jgi:hypothetical protein